VKLTSKKMHVSVEAGRNFSLRHYWASLFVHFGLRKIILWLLESVYNMILAPLPIAGGAFIRKLCYRPLFKACGRGFMTSPGVRLLHSYNISLGDRCSLNYDTILNGRGGLIIGDDFTTGPGVIVWTVEHYYKDSARRILEQGEHDAPVTIGNDVWCGMRAIIMPGVTVADGTVVAAGAVVTKNTEPYSVVAGVPARIIGRRGPENPVK